MTDPFPPRSLALLLLAPLLILNPLVHQLQKPIKYRQEDIFLGGEVVSQLPAAHSSFFFDLGQGEILQSLLGNNGHGRLNDLLTADLPYVNAWCFHPCSGRDGSEFSAKEVGSLTLD